MVKALESNNWTHWSFFEDPDELVTIVQRLAVSGGPDRFSATGPLSQFIARGIGRETSVPKTGDKVVPVVTRNLCATCDRQCDQSIACRHCSRKVYCSDLCRSRGGRHVHLSAF